jgi:hypothetical protein
VIVNKKKGTSVVLKQACYLIEQDGDENFKIVGTSINWYEQSGVSLWLALPNA